MREGLKPGFHLYLKFHPVGAKPLLPKASSLALSSLLLQSIRCEQAQFRTA
jgi:hypothetical protein